MIGFAGADPGRVSHNLPGPLGAVVSLLADDLWARPPVPAAARPWTDDRAPVEWITDRMIVSYAADGGALDEDFLPSKP